MRVNDTGSQKFSENITKNLSVGQRVTVKVLGKLDNGMYAVSIKGQTITAKIDNLPQNSSFRAEIIGTDPFTIKMIESAEEGANKALLKQGFLNDRMALILGKGTISVQEGEKLNIDILKSLGKGNFLVNIKGELFNVNLGHTALSTLTAEVMEDGNNIILSILPGQAHNLNLNMLKSEIGGFDLAKIMKSIGKFSNINMGDISGEKLKAALKNSGLFFENNLVKGENVSGDEKYKAYMTGDNAGREAITKMQLANLLLAGGLFSFLKTEDDEVSDALLKYKKNEDGKSSLYMSMEFSNIGKTFIHIRTIGDKYNINVKTEVDISEQIKSLDFEHALVTWGRYQMADDEIFEIKKEVAPNIARFDVKA